MQTIILASDNDHKIQELQALCASLPFNFEKQGQHGVSSVSETATTFVENAIIKARHASEQTGLPAMADDSGLVVDALKGAPGVYSARYAGAQASDLDNNRKLLQTLAGVPASQRQARFVCVIAYLRFAADPLPIICQGIWEGAILTEARGANGFGYDPLFWVPSEQCSSAELAASVKNKLSHRGQALQQFAKRLENQ